MLFLILSLLAPQKKRIFSFFLPLLPLSFITLFIHLFIRFPESAYWQAFASWPLWEKAIYFSLRNANILLIMTYLIRQMQQPNYQNIIAKLENYMSPRFAQPLSIACYYSSMIQDEFLSIQQTHRIMGIRKPGKLSSKIKYYISLIIPAILASFEKADHLSLAMTSRGYNLTKT